MSNETHSRCVELKKKIVPFVRSPTRSMLVGVKSQMTGWFSGGIPGLSRGAGQGADGESQAGKPMNGAQMAQNTESTVAEQTKDDDASR